MTDKEYIWGDLLSDIGNEYGVAGLMGNLQAESGLIPYRVQGDFSEGYTDSITYTNNVDTGVISESDFVHNGPGGGGYGLAQWTYYSRKQALFDMKKSGAYSSIGSVELAVAYLLYELKTDFKSVYNTLKTATSIRVASDSVLHDFESPADQSESVEILRAEMGTAIYNELSGSPPIDPDNPPINPDTPSVKTKTKKKKFNFILFNQRRFIR
jgi:hypothetical protein